MPPSTLRCANHDSEGSCDNAGIRFCSKCKLVCYCSADCQRKHWPMHKLDCNSPLNSEKWQPAYIRQSRVPNLNVLNETHALGVTVWGNIPALDILNLSRNEGVAASKTRDFSLAYVACGDLRNVVKTVNALPEDYSGSLNIVLNDHNPMTICRNFLVLLILAREQDMERSSELALHLWYSLFLSEFYMMHVSLVLLGSGCLDDLKTGNLVHLTGRMTVQTYFDNADRMILMRAMQTRLSREDASQAFYESMNAPGRLDSFRDMFYAILKPHHRLAFDKWRSIGVLLPFGEAHAHMCVPNPWIFAEQKGKVRYLPNDHDTPLQGWDIDAMVAAGKAHGTTEFDLFGCAFFYVKDELMAFAHRLQKFKINISLHAQDARDMPAILEVFCHHWAVHELGEGYTIGE
ncbi:hypothetical protein BDZ89DRAFT_1063034 [Hymenopellis radicata]|nr:hypothetical protein BDZ89DRAFT_1063034 [Hymenopellis radicata]